MRLYIARHADALPPASGEGDLSRPLSAWGVQQAHGLARALGAAESPVDVRPTQIVHSPARRAAETARPACEALGAVPHVDDRLVPNTTVSAVREVIRELVSSGAPCALVVGHNPCLSDFVRAIDPAAASLQPADVAVFTVDPGGALSSVGRLRGSTLAEDA
ncbi:MAG: histidine phosphatase family protein [Planctomycetota bacterium]|nr:histidine phosphatase family protein [Planctomycetota bacterium]